MDNDKTSEKTASNKKGMKNPKVDAFIAGEKKWQKEFAALRKIVLGCPVVEDFKWRVPCYTVDGGNVVMIHGFKEYCALLFVKGAILKDKDGILIQQTANVQAARQIRFAGLDEIQALAPTLKKYIMEAIELEKSGAAVELKKNTDFDIPKELLDKYDRMPELAVAFQRLTPGRQRAYILYFTQPKLGKTREARVEKYVAHILEGKGLND